MLTAQRHSQILPFVKSAIKNEVEFEKPRHLLVAFLSHGQAQKSLKVLKPTKLNIYLDGYIERYELKGQ
jgi:hypothetical protein